MEIWEDSDEDDDMHPAIEATPARYSLLRCIAVFLIMWQFQYGISEAGVVALIIFLHHLF